MTTSALRRQVKNIVHNYSEAEVKVREATSNDPWGPSSSLMSEIAELTFSVAAFSEVMAMVWKRLNDHGKNWRHVYKALTLLDYLAKTGSERVAQQCRENAFTIQTLRDFQYVDRDGRDQGVNVREKAKQLVALLRDEDRLRHERALALKTKERLASAGGGGGSGAVPPSYPSRRSSQPSMAALYGEEFSRSMGSPSSFTSSPSSPRASDLEHSRPQTSGEEELQLQLALAMSREEHRKGQEDESEVEKAVDKRRRGSESGPGSGESAMIDLVDIFEPSGPSEVPSSDDLWDAQPSCPLTSDPWKSVAVVNPSTPVVGSPWKPHPSSSSPDDHWVINQSPSDPWISLPTKSTKKSAEQPWRSPVRPASAGVGQFPIREEEEPGDKRPNSVFSPRCESPADIDPFAELVVGGQVNGRVEASSVTFDHSHLGPPLDSVTHRKCCTPEAFLGPTAASLINLDTLIPPKQHSQTQTLIPSNIPANNKNPFLSGLSAPSPTNPFHCDQRRLTLNQMRPNSTSPLPAHALPGALPYSASLPLPSSQNMPQPLDLPPNLPQPLLPLSSMPRLQTAPQLQSHGNNPFL
ncbi:epsin-3 [Ictalurus punctatus]|uniref:Epsin-3 n=1 Tax=Ictalurus punctatus TaxID=7998 RepID=A0A2D0Q6S5_ICTPU|nr:epsin-3 [Ictalurus punctatus]